MAREKISLKMPRKPKQPSMQHYDKAGNKIFVGDTVTFESKSYTIARFKRSVDDWNTPHIEFTTKLEKMSTLIPSCSNVTLVV